MQGFTLVWLGQIVSVLASNMTGFALTIWMYQQTRSTTAMALMQVCFILPFLLLSPIAGAMVDRYNRKLMMMVSDLTAVLSTAGILVLYATGNLEFWHMYIASVINGLGNTFQWPAYSAAISTMVSKDQYSRANGMMSLVESGPAVLSPMLAGMLLPVIGLTGILTLDVATFFIAILALLLVVVPQPEKTLEGQQGRGNLWKESAFGFQYIFKRPSLLGLQMVFFFGNLFSGLAFTAFAPMILDRTADNTTIFATVQTFGAIGGITGGILMSVWAGFKKRVNGVLAGWLFSGLIFTLVGFGQTVWIWAPVMVVESILAAMINTSNQAIWQAKVAPDAQGRVFSARRLIAWFTQPIAPLIGGVLADYVLEPAMQTTSGPLFTIFSPLVGTGPGSGKAILFIFSGLAIAVIGMVAFSIHPIRSVESILPDHDTLEKAAGDTTG
ncbi:MAG: MFS transporter [Anaerolineae bacterium]|nr:MFS transporter [Anaerolineae bacterium]